MYEMPTFRPCGALSIVDECLGDNVLIDDPQEIVRPKPFTRTYAGVPLQTLDQRSGGPLGEARVQLYRVTSFASLA
jgi:hypothetical protein